MSNWRDQKRAAREVVHDTMAVPAFYYAPGEEFPVPCRVRVHTDFKALGDMSGTSYDFATLESVTPRLIFWVDELNPAHDGIVVLSPEEGYALGVVRPRDRETVTVEVSRLTTDEALSLWPGE